MVTMRSDADPAADAARLDRWVGSLPGSVAALHAALVREPGFTADSLVPIWAWAVGGGLTAATPLPPFTEWADQPWHREDLRVLPASAVSAIGVVARFYGEALRARIGGLSWAIYDDPRQPTPDDGDPYLAGSLLPLMPLRDVLVAAQRALFHDDPDPARLRRTFVVRCTDLGVDPA
jgi:hypothetical protein